MWACQGGGAGRCAAKIVRSVPVANGSVKKPTRPQTGPFLGVGKCIPGPLRVRIAPSGAKSSGGELVVRGSAGFFTDPSASGTYGSIGLVGGSTAGFTGLRLRTLLQIRNILKWFSSKPYWRLPIDRLIDEAAERLSSTSDVPCAL